MKLIRRALKAAVLMGAISALVPAMALATSDLSITNTDNPDPVVEGDGFNYIIKVSNAGPDTANNVDVIDVLPTQVSFVKATAPGGGSCGLKGRRVTCNLGALENGRTGKARIRVKADAAGVVVNTARLTSNDPDPNHDNNSATTTTTVFAAPTCAGVRASIVGTEGNDPIIGTDKRDVIVALGGNDSIEALRGNDVVCGGAGDDTIKTQGGNDTARGGSGDDSVRGGGGNDNLRGGGGSDSVQGGTADDVLQGVGGSDLLKGLGGTDRLSGGGGADSLHGGGGVDACTGGGGRDDKHSC